MSISFRIPLKTLTRPLARLPTGSARSGFKRAMYQVIFRALERRGFHLTPAHYYSPIPNTQALPNNVWVKHSALAGVNMNDSLQLHFLRNVFPAFRAEYDAFPKESLDHSHRFHLSNSKFGGIDALSLYCMIRHFKPNHIIEIGAGISSIISATAILTNERGKLSCIEPFPHPTLMAKLPNFVTLIQQDVQSLSVDYFTELSSGDVLFIDSSHVVKVGSDVVYLFLEVIPRLKPGVVVHVHDIFLPEQYPKVWIQKRGRFWNEQYILQAFLAFNPTYEVLLANRYLALYYQSELKDTFPNSNRWKGASFWFRRMADP